MSLRTIVADVISVGINKEILPKKCCLERQNGSGSLGPEKL